MSGIQQVDNGRRPRAGTRRPSRSSTARASSPQTTSKAGVQRAQVASDLGGGTTAVADRVAANNGEANEIAKSTLQRMADAFFEADGVAFGNPAIRAGGKVKVKGVGTKFGGDLHGHVLDAHLPRHDRLPDDLPDLRPLAPHAAGADAPARRSATGRRRSWSAW